MQTIEGGETRTSEERKKGRKMAEGLARSKRTRRENPQEEKERGGKHGGRSNHVLLELGKKKKGRRA